MEKDKIIIIDDDPANRKLLEEALKPIGGQIFIAASASSALGYIFVEKPDLVISDVNMPGMDGFQLTEKIRLNEKTRDIPVILVTGMDARDLKIRGLKAGCDDFINKPFDLSELQTRVRSMLRLSFYRRQLSSRKQLDFIFEHISDGLIVTDHQFKILRINHKAEKFLNVKGTGKKFSSFIKKHYTVQNQKNDLFDKNNSRVSAVLFREATDNVSSLYLNCEISWVKRENRAENQAIIILKDVTAEQTERRLKHDFLSLISHKLRSPLAVIGGLSKVLERELKTGMNEKQSEIFDELKLNTIRLEQLVDRLIRFSIINNVNLRDQQHAFFHPLDSAKKAVKQTVYFFGKKTIQTQYNNRLGKNFNLNQLTEEQFLFIISSLVENAIKFSHANSIKIQMNFSSNEDQFVFSISDNGPGIPPEVQERIFESFYQYEKIFTGNIEGMGIGLAMVKQLLEKCNGRIWVQSQLNRGTTFFITIPLDKKNGADDFDKIWT